MIRRSRSGAAVTLADVAHACGVSPSTVSRALAGSDKVRPATREQIRRVAQEMAYSPNRSARSLSMGRTGTIGVIVPDIANPFFPPIIKAIQARAATKDISVLLVDTDEHVADELDRAHALVRQVDGLVLVSPRTPEKDLPAILQLVPTVFVNRRVPDAPSVVVENSEGIDQAVQHLHALGHRRICYLSGPRRSWSNERRRASLTTACARQGVELAEFGPFEPQMQAGVRAADLLRASGCTAVIAYDDMIALGVMARLAEHGLRVGRDISVVGIDDSPMSGVAYPTLTSIHIPGSQAGGVAVDLLLRRLDTDGVGPGGPFVELETHLVVRGSTGPARSERSRSRRRTGP